MMIRLLMRRLGSPVWDRFLRLSMVVVLLAIPVTLWVPAAGGLVAFGLITVWVNGPLAPLLPSTYEPIVILAGRVFPPLLVAALGTAGTIYAEYVNYHLYRHVLRANALERARESRVAAWVLARFRRAPFFTIWLCSWSVIPYWPVRFIGPLAGYPVGRQMVATALGRFPRIWIFAAFGALLQVEVGVLALISLGLVALAIGIYALLVRRALRGRRAGGRVGVLEAAEG
jgi:uncharacterized membrane protein YdjX (TVP38/TMEM64 family)